MNQKGFANIVLFTVYITFFMLAAVGALLFVSHPLNSAAQTPVSTQTPIQRVGGFYVYPGSFPDYTATVPYGSAALPDGIAGESYLLSFTYNETMSPDPSRTYTATFGNLPAGLSVNSSGGPSVTNLPYGSGSFMLAGSPLQSGTYDIILTIASKDSTRIFATRNYTLKINPGTITPEFVISPETLPNGLVGFGYQAAIAYSQTNFDPIKTLSATFSSLPPGMYIGIPGTLRTPMLPAGKGTINIHGAPLQEGTYDTEITFRLNDGSNRVLGTKKYTIRVNVSAPSLSLTFTPTDTYLPAGFISPNEYSATINYSGLNEDPNSAYMAVFTELPTGLYVGDPGNLYVENISMMGNLFIGNLPTGSGNFSIKGFPNMARWGGYDFTVTIYQTPKGTSINPPLDCPVGQKKYHIGIDNIVPRDPRILYGLSSALVGQPYSGTVQYSDYFSMNRYAPTSPLFTARVTNLPPGLYVGSPNSTTISGLSPGSGFFDIQGVPLRAGLYSPYVEIVVLAAGGLEKTVLTKTLALNVNLASVLIPTPSPTPTPTLSPSLSPTPTPPTLTIEQKIKALLEQIKALQDKIKALQAQQGQVQQPGLVPTYTYTRDLYLSSQGDDVVALQAFLESKGFLVMPPNTPKSYFGPLTRQALASYQQSVDISPTLGYFGPKTKAHLNVLSQ
jgi:hypothetical protein